MGRRGFYGEIGGFNGNNKGDKIEIKFLLKNNKEMIKGKPKS